jgi:hypothetical protein
MTYPISRDRADRDRMAAAAVGEHPIVFREARA